MMSLLRDIKLVSRDKSVDLTGVLSGGVTSFVSNILDNCCGHQQTFKKESAEYIPSEGSSHSASRLNTIKRY